MCVNMKQVQKQNAEIASLFSLLSKFVNDVTTFLMNVDRTYFHSVLRVQTSVPFKPVTNRAHLS